MCEGRVRSYKMQYLNGGASGGTEHHRPHFHVLNMVLSSGMVEERCTCEGCNMFCTCPPSCSSMICCDNYSKRGRRGGGEGEGEGKEGEGGDAREEWEMGGRGGGDGRERRGRWEGEEGEMGGRESETGGREMEGKRKKKRGEREE